MKKGSHHSETAKEKLRLSHLGKEPWNKGISTAMLGKSRPVVFKSKTCECCGIKYIPMVFGKRWEVQRFCSSKCRGKAIGTWNRGKKGLQVAWNKGIPLSEERCDQLSELAKKRVGELANNWHGGISFLPYCFKFNKELKEAIRNRDNRTCQYCSQIENDRKLSVHHIHYDKENCNPDLIALCNKCNCKVNGNREYYESLFMNKLNERELLFWKRSE